MDEVSANLLKLGLKWIGSPALATDAGGVSSGAIILLQPCVNVWTTPREVDLFPGRLTMCYVTTQELGTVALYCIYLETGKGLQGTNIEVLESMLVHIAKNALLDYITCFFVGL